MDIAAYIDGAKDGAKEVDITRSEREFPKGVKEGVRKETF